MLCRQEKQEFDKNLIASKDAVRKENSQGEWK